MKGIAVMLVLFFACAASHADVLHLKDGSRIKGEVTQMDESEVKITLPYGTLAVKRADVVRIDLGEEGAGPAVPGLPTGRTEEEKIQAPEAETEPDSSQSLGLPPEPAERKERKSPSSAAMLAVIPGGGYAYLERWDLALGAAGLELGLTALGMSLVSDEGEGKNSTGYVVLGFLGLLKVAEILDSRDRAEEWNRHLDEEAGGAPRSDPLARIRTGMSGDASLARMVCSFRFPR